MAVTLRELVYDIKNIAYGGVSSDDAKVNDRQIAYWVKQGRSMLLSQFMNKKMRIPQAAIETLKYVQLEPVDASEACEVDLGVFVLKSKNEIPRTIQRNERNSIFAVESLDGQRPFSETTDFRRKWNSYNKYTSSKNRWYVKDNHLYVSSDLLIEAVKITGVFEDPEDIYRFNVCDGKSCHYDWDSPFPLSLSMAETITNLTLQSKLGVTLSMPSDETNNAKQDGEIPIKGGAQRAAPQGK